MKKRTISRQTFLKRVKDTIRQYDMLHEGDRVLAAVSGGADSVCMLRALVSLRKQLGIEVLVANLDHGIRGRESEADSDFVAGLCEDLGLECFHKKVSVKSGGRKGASLEERAREARYAFLSGAAKTSGCGVMATGHTMDDQAETVLLKIIYGSSLRGIAGIPPVRGQEGIKVIRPLIRSERKDILGFLEQSGAVFVEDSSNKDTRFLRNRVRLEALPFLEKFNPQIKRSLANLSDILREDLDFLREEKDKALKRCAGGRGGVFSVKVRDVILQPKTLRKEVFKELFSRAGGNVKKLTYRHWMDMDVFLRTSGKNRSLDLPGGVKVIRSGDNVEFRKRARSGRVRGRD